MTTNALTASNKVLIPLQCEFYALEGLSQILRVIKDIKSGLNSSLDLDGILLTMYDSRNKLSFQVEEVREVMGSAVYEQLFQGILKYLRHHLMVNRYCYMTIVVLVLRRMLI